MSIVEDAASPAAGMVGPKPPALVKLAYSFGQAAQSGGFDAALGFIFFYYAAVLGLSGALVGAAVGGVSQVRALESHAAGRAVGSDRGIW